MSQKYTHITRKENAIYHTLVKYLLFKLHNSLKTLINKSFYMNVYELIRNGFVS